MAQELVKRYGRTVLSPRCAIKIDLQKAFDTLSWSFLLDVLASLKMDPIFINWIKSCLTNPRYSISFNGGLEGYFKGARGVRQGDPLSPYLFVIAMDILSKLLDIAAAHGVYDYHPKCKRIKLTHLCFADDLMIFTKGNVESIVGIQNVLKLFYTFSGLQLNNEKSEIFSSEINGAMMEEIQRVSGFKAGTLPVRYLGVPLVTRRLSMKDCSNLEDKIKARINSWSAKLLTYAGRIQLIQSVLYNIQNFWCRHFILPKGVLKRIMQLCSSFLWKGKDQSARGARVSWDCICYPKSEGGLGL